MVLLFCLTILVFCFIIAYKIAKYIEYQTKYIRSTGNREQVTIDNVPYSQKGIWKK